MFKLIHLTSVTTLALMSSFVAAKVATAVTITERSEGFGEGAIYTGFFVTEDLNDDGAIILEDNEVETFLSGFSGNSIIPAFAFTIEDLAFSQPNTGTYNYGSSLSDTSDDILFYEKTFYEDSANNLFIRIESNNNYSESSGTTTITKYTSNDFLTVEGSVTSNELRQLTPVSEPPTTVPEPQNLGVLIALGLVGISARTSSYLAKQLKDKKL